MGLSLFRRSAPVPLLIQRSHRLDPERWSTARSFLGGAPQLGDVPWPRDHAGKPMWHVATLDLADCARVAPKCGLPKSGQLAFFFSGSGGFAGAVRHVKAPASCALPDDLEAPGDHWMPVPRQDHLPATARSPLFPRWPVQVLPWPKSPEAYRDLVTQAIGGAHHQQDLASRLSRMERAPEDGTEDPRKMTLAQMLAPHLPNGLAPWLWDTAQRFAASLRYDEDGVARALERHRKQLAKAETQLQNTEAHLAKAAPEDIQQAQDWVARARKKVANKRGHVACLEHGMDDYRRFVETLRDWSMRHVRWSEMGAADIDTLTTAFDQLYFSHWDAETTPFGAIYEASVRNTASTRKYASLTEAHEETLRALIVAEPEDFARLPPGARHDIALRYALTDSAGHMMFGEGADLQARNQSRSGKTLLLQLGHDEILGLGLGDNGVVQYWISPGDMKSGRFETVEITADSN